MAGPSVTYTFTNGTVADASQVNQNFTDLINGLTDGTKDLNINALTAAGAATFNGNTTIGNASGDTSTVNATMSFATTPKADTIDEKTSTNGVQIKGRTSGNAIGAGYVGEILGSEQAGAGGSGYNTRTIIAATTGGDYVTSLTLNKGVYLVGFHTVQSKAANTNSDRLVCYMHVGATVVTTDLASNNSNISGSKLVSTFTIPVKITADSTTVQVSVTMGTDNSVGATNSMWAIRIA